MKRYPFTQIALLLGIGSFLWALLPLKWNVYSDWPALVSSLFSAYAFLIACRLLIYRRCPWSVVFSC